MQLLLRTLQDHDLGHLRILAELWGFDLPPGSARQAVKSLANFMLDPANVEEIVGSLPVQVRRTLDHVVGMGGRVPLSDFVRRYGPLRDMGPGRRDREKPWRTPASPIEALWYRGLIARAFSDTRFGPREYAFIPTDLFSLLPKPSLENGSKLLGQPAEPPPRSKPATSTAVDDATTLLATLRRQPCNDSEMPPTRRQALVPFLRQPRALDLLLKLLQEETILVSHRLQPQSQSARAFLNTPRAEALRGLLLAWARSSSWNDLQQVPLLTCNDDKWPNDPLTSRQAALELIRPIPLRAWWDLDRFVEATRNFQPGFQRPAGDFDSWYLRDTHNGTFLRGFKHWDAIDGALLRFLITGPLHWLGASDLGRSRRGGTVTCFRLTPAAAILFDPQAPLTIKESTASATIQPNGRITVPRRALRALRYQISRFTSWDPIDEEHYYYRLTPTALAIADGQGLQLSHIFTILETAGGGPLPSTLRNALQRWGDNGEEARLERQLILRVDKPEILEELQSNRTTARHLGEILGPTAIVVREHDWIHLCDDAARMGILIDPPQLSSSD